MRIFVIWLCLSLGTVHQVSAENAQLEPIWDAMKLGEFINLLSIEGKAEAKGLERSMFKSSPGRDWEEAVSTIYTVGGMSGKFRAALSKALDKRLIPNALKFYQSDFGQEVIELELSARQSLLDPDIETVAIEAHLEAIETDRDRLELIERFSDANDLVENNVMGAMNGNYAFLSSLADRGQGPFAQDRSAILSVIWSQESEIRDETVQWLHSYYYFAFGPLTDDRLEALIQASGEADHRRLNSALFEAFDVLLVGIANELGAAAAQVLSADEL